MKKLIFVFLLSSIAFAQSAPSLEQLKLKQEMGKLPDKTGKVFLSQDTKLERKNPGMAVILSLLLPGMGELYAGSYDEGRIFTIADGVLWGTVIGLNSYANWKKDDYIAYARTYGGITTDGKNEDFYANLGDYLSVEDYNRYKDLQREFSDIYNVQKYYWNWGSDTRRKEYRDMWRSSEQAFNSIRFAVGALILNRIISVVNAVRIVTAHNKKVEQQKTLEISFSPNYLERIPVGMSLNIRAAL